MRIKKVSNKVPTQGNIIDGNSQSITDAYSANFVNTLLDRGNNYITVRGNGDTTYNYSTAWNYQHIDINTVDKSNGDLLTFNNNHIVIGAGVSRIRISGLIGLWGCPNTAIEIHPRKNDNSIKTIYYTKATASGTENVPIPPIILDVSEGDKIDVAFTAGYTGSYTLLTRANVSYLTVEAIQLESQVYERHKPITGSNSSAKYIKYEDGTLIQYGKVSITTDTFRSAGGLSYYSGEDYVTLPYNFIDTNYITITDVKLANMNIFCQSYGVPTFEDSVRIIYTATNNSETRNIDFICIGRWK